MSVSLIGRMVFVVNRWQYCAAVRSIDDLRSELTQKKNGHPQASAFLITYRHAHASAVHTLRASYARV